MAQYTKAQVTQLGHNLNAKVLGNEPHVLEFTRIVTSDTDYSSNDLVLMEGITNIRQTGSLSGTVVQDDQFNVKGTFDTADIESGYYMRTIALYANDPDKGEILYAVVACDPADYIHSRGDVGDSIIHFDFAIKVTGAQNVTITIPTTGLVTVHEINDIRDELDNQFAGLEDEINSDFSSLSADIDQRFQTKTNELNTSFTNLSNNLSTQVDNKIDELEDGFGVFKTATQSEINAFKTAAQADIDNKTAAMQSTVTSSINSMNSQMDTHTTNVNNLISEGEDLYEDMRDQSAELDTKFTNKSSELDNKFNTLEDNYDERVTTLEGETSALETGLSNLDSKVDQEVSTIDERVDTLQTELTQAVQGGGRNLFVGAGMERTGSREFINHSTWDIAPIVEKYGIGEEHLYTVSFDIKSPVAGSVQLYTQNGSGAKYHMIFKENNQHSITVPVTEEWQRYSYTFHPELFMDTENRALVAFYGSYDSGRIPSVRRMKLELGSIASEYTRAPEDIEADIAAAQYGADQANTIVGSGFFSESSATPSTTFPVTIEPTNEVQTFEIPLTTQWVAGKRYRIDLEGDFPYETKLKLYPANLEGGNEFNVVSGSFQKYVDVTTLQNTESPKMVFTIDSTPATPEEGEPEPNTRATRINSVKVVYLEGETLTQRSIRHQNEIKALESAVPTKLDKSAVTNNLTSTSTTNALSAAQGKALQDNKLDKSAVTNSLTSTSTTNALSAAQGKVLADGKVDKSQLSTSGTANTVAQRDASGNLNVGNNLTVSGSVSASTPMTHVYGQTLAGTLQLRTVANAKADLGITALEGSTVKRSDIVNTLTSTSTSAPLSAAQGKALQDGKLDKSDVLNTLTSSSVTQALSANQGRLLNNAVNAKMNANATVDSLTSTSATLPLSAKQGKALQDNKVNKSDVVNTFDSSPTTGKVLSSHGGYLLYQNKADQADLETLETLVGTKANSSDLSSLATTVGGKLDKSVNSPDMTIDDIYQLIQFRASAAEFAELYYNVADMSDMLYSTDNFATEAHGWADELKRITVPALQEQVNGVETVANSANSTAASAQSVANSAYSRASTAITDASTAQSRADSAHTLASNALPKTEPSYTPRYSQTILANHDLNGYTTAGFYHTAANAVAATLKNSPTDLALTLVVLKNAGITQYVTEYQTCGVNMWVRNNYQTNWGEWEQIPTFKMRNNFPVLAAPTTYFRTPSAGMLPYDADTSKGSGSLGTRFQPFMEINSVEVAANTYRVLAPNGSRINLLAAAQPTNTTSGIWASLGDADRISGINIRTRANAFLAPAEDDNVYLGLHGQRWKAIYSVNGTVQTSGKKHKEDITLADDVIDELLDKASESLVTFKYKKHEGMLGQHLGLIADDLKDLEGFKYIGIEEKQEDGTVEYGLKPLAVASLALRGYKKQKDKVNALEERVKSLEEAVFSK